MKKIVSTTRAPKALAPYSQAVIDTGTGLIFTAGQIPIDNETGEVVGQDIEEQAGQVFKNLGEVLKAAGSGFKEVLKVTVFLKDLGDFAKFNRVYSEYFREELPARSAVEVAGLPKDVLLEVELVAHV